jgi:hypothetical protein
VAMARLSPDSPNPRWLGGPKEVYYSRWNFCWREELL